MKTILIIGINGFLGSNLANLIGKNYNILGLEYSCDNLYRLKDKKFKVFETKNGIPKDFFKKNKIDTIINAATFYGRNNENDNEILYSNTFLLHQILEKSVNSGCKLFINTSTVLEKFTNAYSLTKHQFNDWLIYYSGSKKIKVINIILEHFYGPGSSQSNFITLMIKKMLRNETNIDLTMGDQKRDFIFIDDVSRAFETILNENKNLQYFEEFNLGSGKSVKLKKLLNTIKNKINSSSNLNFGAIDYRNNEIMNSKLDISKLKLLGWMPEFSLDEGIDKVINYEINNLKKI